MTGIVSPRDAPPVPGPSQSPRARPTTPTHTNGAQSDAETFFLDALPSHDKPYYYSDSDDESDRPDDDFVPPLVSNRGNKLKRGARDISRGRLGGWPKFGFDHEDAVRKRMRVDLTPALSLQSRTSAREPRPRLPPPPRNPVDLMTSPGILRTFASRQSHLPGLALSAINLIEADAPLVRVLNRVCDVLRGDRVPFIDDRAKEVAEEHARTAEVRRKAAEEAARAPPPPPAVEPEVDDEDEEAYDEEATIRPEIEANAEVKDERVPSRPDGADPDFGSAPESKPVLVDRDGRYVQAANGDPMTDIDVGTAMDESSPVKDDIAVNIPVNGDMDVDVAAGGEEGADDEARDNSRSTSPEERASRRRSGRRAAAKATAANANLSRERSPTPDAVADDDDDDEQIPTSLETMLPPIEGQGPGGHLPPSLRRLTTSDAYVRSLFVTEDAAVNVPGVAQALEAEDQYRTLHQSLTELQRFLADTIEYQERLGEIRDGALGVERRRKGLYAIVRSLASDYIDYETVERMRA